MEPLRLARGNPMDSSHDSLLMARTNAFEVRRITSPRRSDRSPTSGASEAAGRAAGGSPPDVGGHGPGMELGRPASRRERMGASVGRVVAGKILAARKGDGSEKNPSYTSPLQAGIFRTFPRESAALTPGWGKVKPFAMRTGDQFHSPPPPDMTSAE